MSRDNPFANAIRWYDGGGKYTHVAIAVSPSHIAEATWYGGVEIREMHYWDEEVEVIDLGITQGQRFDVVQTVFDFIGQPYDYLQLVGFFTKRWVDKDMTLNNPSQQICSELVGRILYRNNLVCDIGIVSNMTPHALYEYVVSLPCGVESAR